MRRPLWNILPLLFACLSITSCRKHSQIDNAQLLEAYQYLWQDAQHADSLARSLDRQPLNSYEQCRLTLLESHLDLKLRQTLVATTDLRQLSDWFLSRKDAASAAEALYIAGAYANWKEENVEAMRYLKEAERLHPDGIIAGMMYYKMGRISETEQLYDVAVEYYERCVPYIDAAQLPYYQACAWRELGRMRTDSTADACFERALSYARVAGDSLLCLDIRYAAAAAHPGSTEAIQISRYLCDSAGVNRYAYDLVKYYIRTEEPELARHYLDVLSLDTVALQWSATQYRLWESQYQRLCGHADVAYAQLLDLFYTLYGRVEQDNHTQTFTIAQRYDNEAERAKNLQLQVEKQRLYLSLAAILVAIFMTLIAAIIVVNRRRTQHLLEKAASERQISQLRNELQLRRQALRRVLEQRLSLTKNLQEAILHKHEKDGIPAWAQEFIQQNIFSTDEQWQAFLDEFNGCYSNIITHLQAAYPGLTAVDMQVIALIVIGLDVSDMCLLLGLTQRTIWSRRQRIRQRLELPEGCLLDDWLREKAEG